MFSENDKNVLIGFIKRTKAKGLEPQKEAYLRFGRVLKELKPNTPQYRIAYSFPIGFYVLHSKKDALKIIRQKSNEN